LFSKRVMGAEEKKFAEEPEEIILFREDGTS
jgi:hypothetical protein